MVPRIAASILASALLRLAERDGGFGAILAKGDEKAGEIIVIVNERGRKARIFERILQPEGQYIWTVVSSQDLDNEEKFEAFLARKRRFDPDLWLIELDVASAERFAAEMNALN